MPKTPTQKIRPIPERVSLRQQMTEQHGARHGQLRGKFKDVELKINELKTKMRTVIDEAKDDVDFVGQIEGMMSTVEIPVDMVLKVIDQYLKAKKLI